MSKRAPNPYSEAEVRRAIQRNGISSDIISSEIDTINAELSIIGGEITVIDGRLDALESGSEDSYSAITDSDVIIGQPLYIKSNSHVDLAYANGSASNARVIGFAIESKSSGQTVKYVADLYVTQSDWTGAAIATNLIPGENYFLLGAFGSNPSYANTGGTGDRRSILTVNTNASDSGDLQQLVDGANNSGNFFWQAQNVWGLFLAFDFGVGASKIITEAKWYQSNGDTHGTWQWNGKKDDVSDWEAIGGTFLLGGTSPQIQTTLSTNIKGYRYYALFGGIPFASGSTSSSPYLYEVEFKIDNFTGGSGGKGTISTTPPNTIGSYLVRVGEAISPTTLDIEIQQPILL